MCANFFGEQKAAAVFKHGILDGYAPPFVAKTGSVSRGNRVAFVDGYAGPGAYDDGTKGSPARAIEIARENAQRTGSAFRRVESHFVEKDASYLERLRALVAAEATDLDVTVYEGDINDYLSEIVATVRPIPAFMFLDPFGLVVPFDAVREVLDRPGGYGMPNVEVLINFSAEGLRRIAGMIDKPASTSGRDASLARMDAVCGGQWWRDVWASNRPAGSEVAEEAVVAGYAARLADGLGYGWWTTDVRNRPEHLPSYYLVFLSRHVDGLSVFGEAHSLALEKWRKAIYDQDNDGSLFESQESFDAVEEQLASAWVDEIEKNLERLLAEGASFKILSRYQDVFGSSVGKARERHLRKAWKSLHARGVTSTDSKGKLYGKTISPT